MFEAIFNYIEREDFIKYLRLSIIVFVYVIFRQYYSNYAKAQQTKRQLLMDEKEKKEKPEREKKERLEKEKLLEKEAASFGWGKKTRKDVKTKQTILEDQLSELRERHQTVYDAAEDHDIEDLLED